MNTPTIYDIAEKSGFSVATVSKVFNNYKGVNEKTVARVLETARQLNYTPNIIAQSLTTKKSFIIGIVCSDIDIDASFHPHFTQILSTFRETVESAGYDTMYINNKGNALGGGFLEHCLSRQVDGALLAVSACGESKVRSLIESGAFPCVSVEDIYPSVPCVISDNRAGTIQMLEYLYNLGHRKIAYISGPLNTTAGKERYDAVLEFVAERGMTLADKYLTVAENYSRADGYAAANKLLSQCWNDPPSVIFCAYDEFAYTAVEVLLERGYRIPQDISVAGFDNLIIGECSTPKITTIAQNRDAIGVKAGELLLQMMNDESFRPSGAIRVPTSLVIRNSVRKPKLSAL